MKRSVSIGLLAALGVVSLLIAACGGGAQAEADRIDAAQAGAIEMGVDPETTGNDADTIGPGGIERCVRIDVVKPGGFDNTSDYNVDVVVSGDTEAPIGYNLGLLWTDTALAHVADPGTDTLIKMPGAMDLGTVIPDSDGRMDVGVAYVSGGPGIPNDGTLTRVGLDINGGADTGGGVGANSGIITFTFLASPLTDYFSTESTTDAPHPQTLGTGQLAINQDCPAVTPTVTPGPTSTSTPPPGSPTPPPGITVLVSGWNYSCYVGPERAFEDALGDVVDKVLAVYQMRTDGRFDRWFPDKPDFISTIAAVSPYQPLFILMAEGASWAQQPSGTPPASVPLMSGWNSVCYTGQTKSAGDAAVGVAGGFAVMYRLASDQNWSRYVPGNSGLSDLAELGQFAAVLMLVNQAGGTSWTFDP